MNVFSERGIAIWQVSKCFWIEISKCFWTASNLPVGFFYWFSNRALKVWECQECLNSIVNLGGGATIAMPRIRYLSAHANSRAVFPFPATGTSIYFYTDEHLHEHLPTFFYIYYLPIYLPVSSLPPRSTYLLERPLHVFVVCSPCCFYEAPYTAPVPYPSTPSILLQSPAAILHTFGKDKK